MSSSSLSSPVVRTSAWSRWLRNFIPAPLAVGWRERVRSCIGALIGIAITGIAMRVFGAFGATEATLPWLVAPMGASAVLLFAVPSSPLAQPWSIMGGNIVSAIVGVACVKLIADPVHAAAVAVAVAIALMFALRCVHPPSGAVALTAVLGGPAIHALGFEFVLAPIAIQSFVLLASAIVYHALTRHPYPHHGPHPQHVSKATRDEGAPLAPSAHIAAPLSPRLRQELDAALRRHGELLDIDPADLEAVVGEALSLARLSGKP